MIGSVAALKRRPFLYPGEEIKPSRSPKLHLHGIAKHALDVGHMRLWVTASLFGLAFALIGVRLVELMVVGTPQSATVARAAGAPGTQAHPSRGRAEIVDRNGVLIATNLPTVNLFADAAKVLDPKLTADRLTAALPDLKYDEVLQKVSSGQRFVYLRRHLTPVEQVAVNRLGLPGIEFEQAERRTYPQGALFAHIVGATDPDNRGNAGIERTFDELLRTDPAPFALSLDIRVQHAVRDALAAGIARFRAEAGSAVVIDAVTGELISMVSLPDFDPKSVGAASDDARFNRATLGLYEMGSTFKLFTVAMGLDSGAAGLTSRYDARTPIKIGRFTINDFHPQTRWLSVPEVIVHSSNIAAAKMALDVGGEYQKAFLRKLGLLSPLSLELPEVGTPQYPATWRDINTITIAYGHGISVTPVHMATAISALVNGGTLSPPTVLRRNPGAAPDGRRVIARTTSDAVRAMMRLNVIEGSGKQADVKGYLVGGKTGSAEKVTRRGGYAKNSLRTSFVAAFPIDAPRYVVLVILDEPKGIKETYNFATAGWNAAPTAGAVIGRIAPLLGVYPVDHDDTFAPLPQIMAAHYASDAEPVAVQPAVLRGDPSMSEDLSHSPEDAVPATVVDSIGALIGRDDAGVDSSREAGGDLE
ncbi:MAG: penicillin-binding protein 2 [Rhodospirillaceae bacterium]|nr:penicillin-binding protein 2 [Rhodospirillaceae bacterium]